MNHFLTCLAAGECFLLAFLLLFHPLRQNQKANQWLAGFVWVMGCAFAGVFLNNSGESLAMLVHAINALQFVLSPCLFISILYFIHPAKLFKAKDALHFVPFVLYIAVEVLFFKGADMSGRTLFVVGNTDFFVRDLLLLQCLLYIISGYLLLIRHKARLGALSSAIQDVDLSWLRNFLLLFTLLLVFWINDALFGETLLLQLMPYIYMGSIFFLAYFSMRQKAIFPFPQASLAEISTFIAETPANGHEKPARLSAERLALLSPQLIGLMEVEQLFLQNDLGLPTVADRLGLSLHDASYLINATTGGNFNQLVNKYRVEEAKMLLLSPRLLELNMTGVAFASGFNSKTAFNTAFKKWTGQSPTAYIENRKNG